MSAIVLLSEPTCLPSHSDILSSHIFLTHHYAGVELVEALHGAIAEAVTQVFLDKVGMVQDVIRHQRLLSSKTQHEKTRNEGTGRGNKDNHSDH